MTTLTLRATKGSPLVSSEVDANFVGLDQEKIQLGGDIGGSTSSPTVVKLRGRTLSSASPTTGQAIVWNGSTWLPQTVSTAGASVSSTVTSVVTSTVSNSVSSTVTSTFTSYPAFSAYASNAELQTITPGSQQKVKFQLEEFDTASCYNSSNSTFTPNKAGYYQLNAEIRFDGNVGTGNELMVAIWKNGAEYKRGWNSVGVSPATNWFSMQVGSLVYANGTTDYFEIYAQHGNSGNLTITGVNSPGITYFNGIHIPTQLMTEVTGTSVVGGTVTSTVVTSAVAGASEIVILNDIYNQFNNKRKIFTLKAGASAITEGIHYTDNRDLTVQIGGRHYNAAVPQTTTLGPWINLYVAEKTYTYKLTGSRIIFYRPIANRQTAEIRINNVSATRQTRSRYPLSANSIVLGD